MIKHKYEHFTQLFLLPVLIELVQSHGVLVEHLIRSSAHGQMADTGVIVLDISSEKVK